MMGVTDKLLWGGRKVGEGQLDSSKSAETGDKHDRGIMGQKASWKRGKVKKVLEEVGGGGGGGEGVPQ